MKKLGLSILMGLLISMAQSAPVVKAASAPPSATLIWTAPTTDTDGSTITGTVTYNVYQGASTSSLAKVQTGLSVLTEVVTTGPGISDGGTAYFAITAVVGGIESAQSNILSKTFPAGTPNAPTLVVQ